MSEIVRKSVMIDHPLAVLLTIVVLSTGMIGMAGATPGEGPPDEMPSAVPDFVSDLLNAIGEFVAGMLEAVANLVSNLTPSNASPTAGVLG